MLEASNNLIRPGRVCKLSAPNTKVLTMKFRFPELTLRDNKRQEVISGRERSWRALGALALACVIPLSGCATTQTGPHATDKPLVLTTFTVLDDMAEQVAGDYL